MDTQVRPAAIFDRGSVMGLIALVCLLYMLVVAVELVSDSYRQWNASTIPVSSTSLTSQSSSPK